MSFTFVLGGITCSCVEFSSNFELNLKPLEDFGANLARKIARAYIDVVKTIKPENLRKSFTPILRADPNDLAIAGEAHSNNTFQVLGILYNDKVNSENDLRKQNSPITLNAEMKTKVYIDHKKYSDSSVKMLKTLYTNLYSKIEEKEKLDCPETVAVDDIANRNSSIKDMRNCSNNIVQLLSEVYNNTVDFLAWVVEKRHNVLHERYLPRLVRGFHRRFEHIVADALNKTNIESEGIRIVNASFNILAGLLSRTIEKTDRRKRNSNSWHLILRRDLNKAVASELDRVCEKYHSCPPKMGFKYYCDKAVTVMLQQKDLTLLRELWVKWLRAIKVMQFGAIMGGQMQLQLRINMKLLEETDDPKLLKIKLTEVRSYTDTGKLLYNHPPQVKAHIGYYSGVIDVVDKLLVHDQELITAWENLITALKGWLQNDQSDTVKPLKTLMSLSVIRLSKLDPMQQDEFKAKLKLLIGPTPFIFRSNISNRTENLANTSASTSP